MYFAAVPLGVPTFSRTCALVALVSILAMCLLERVVPLDMAEFATVVALLVLRTSLRCICTSGTQCCALAPAHEIVHIRKGADTAAPTLGLESRAGRKAPRVWICGRVSGLYGELHRAAIAHLETHKLLVAIRARVLNRESCWGPSEALRSKDRTRFANRAEVAYLKCLSYVARPVLCAGMPGPEGDPLRPRPVG